MKKLLLISILLCIPTLTPAIDNTLQKDDETVIHSIVTSPIGQLSRHYATLKLDYINYKLEKSPTVYSQILDLENTADTLANPDVNKKYLTQLKELYLFIVCFDEKSITNNTFLQAFNDKRITVDNNEYKQLDSRLKLLLSVVNVYN